MSTATAFSFVRRLGARVRELGSKKASSGGWHGARMVSAERAILDRVPLVDLVVEVRDARIPSTSALKCLKEVSYSHKHMIVLNKVDLADCSQTKKWMKHFANQNYHAFGVNAHNKDNIKELLGNIRARVRELKHSKSHYTAIVMLVGIPNVGKSAIANSMHLIGRIGAAEKGKLKHAVVSPFPGETKDISAYKIASHPNLYILDTPGILSAEVADDDEGYKLALTGAIKDSFVGEYELAKCFLAVLSSAEEYKSWVNLENVADDLDIRGKSMAASDTSQGKKRQYSSDHTQDFIVKNVRMTLFKAISSLEGSLVTESEMERLVEFQLLALQEAFRLPIKLSGEKYRAVAAKLLNLYRTGRLGHYTLDLVPSEVQELIVE